MSLQSERFTKTEKAGEQSPSREALWWEIESLRTKLTVKRLVCVVLWVVKAERISQEEDPASLNENLGRLRTDPYEGDVLGDESNEKMAKNYSDLAISWKY